MERLRVLQRQVILQLPQAPIDEHGVLLVSPSVRDALREGVAVVALESTIISHGMPYPQNLETALAVEAQVRAQGAVPATIAILDGQCIIGLDGPQIERLARLGPERVRKVSRRDLAHVISTRGHGATTVSATMLLAHAVGIRVFVTGGIGGVHRGGQDSLDISADLAELARTPVCVVCAGIKSILDIGRTLEVLETLGVTVATLGTEGCDFPAFFTATSGVPSPLAWPDEAAAAAAVQAAQQLGLGSGQLVAVEVPASQAAEGARVEAAIQRALREAEVAGVCGAEVTPFLLKRVNELTEGESLRANVALILHNAEVGARIAVELARRLRAPVPEFLQVGAAPARHGGAPREGAAATATAAAAASYGGTPGQGRRATVLVVGGAVCDLVGFPRQGCELRPGDSAPGTLTLSSGGVARNMAEALARLGCDVRLVSAVGCDALGALVLRECEACGLATDGLVRVGNGAAGGVGGDEVSEDARTATYTALHGADGEVLVAIADMRLLERIDAAWVRAHVAPRLAGAAIAVADANISNAGLLELSRLCEAARVPLFLEPVSQAKAQAVASSGALRGCGFVSPNEGELLALARGLGGGGVEPTGDAESSVRRAAERVLASPSGPHTLIISRAESGLLVASRLSSSGGLSPSPSARVRFTAYPALRVSRVRSTRGAGDSLAAGFLAGWLRGAGEAECVRLGLEAARASVESERAISPLLTPALLDGLIVERDRGGSGESARVARGADAREERFV